LIGARDIDQAAAQIEKGQHLAGHFPDVEALDRARSVLTGQLSLEDAFAELEAKHRDARATRASDLP